MTTNYDKNLEKFKKDFKKYEDKFELLSEYKGSRYKLKLKCKECGHIFERNSNLLFIKKLDKCPECSKKEQILKYKKLFINNLNKLYNNEYKLISDYTNINKKVKLKHIICKKVFEVKPKQVLRKDNKNYDILCPFCRKDDNQKEKLKEFKRKLFKKFGNEFKIINENDFVNFNSELQFYHEKCDKIFKTKRLSAMVNPKTGWYCPVCQGNYHKKDSEYFKKEIFELSNNQYTLLSEYIDNKTKVKIRHNECGNEYLVQPYLFIQGRRCPKCAFKYVQSKTELSFLEFLKSFNLKVIENDRTILKGKEIDIYLPDKNIAFEYNGLYWHSEYKGKDENYHLNKTLECEKQGIRLIHIFEDEWINKQDIVKSKIKHLLGLNTNEKIYARKCFIEEISTKDKNQFLNENHIQGEDRSSIKLGLWYPINDEESMLVSVMTFCKPRKSLNGSSEYDYELSRFASEINYNVVGGFSKLLSYFKKNYEWKSIITYADRRWSVGNVYEKNGFNLHHISKPNYWYFKNKLERYHRFNFRKQKLKELFPNIYNDNMSEKEIMKQAGYYIIWDCGNFVFTYINK